MKHKLNMALEEHYEHITSLSKTRRCNKYSRTLNLINLATQTDDSDLVDVREEE